MKARKRKARKFLVQTSLKRKLSGADLPLSTSSGYQLEDRKCSIFWITRERINELTRNMTKRSSPTFSLCGLAREELMDLPHQIGARYGGSLRALLFTAPP